MERDWRDDRIEELEAQVGALEVQLRTRDERIADLERQGALLAKQVAELNAKLGQNSANSHLPPSTDSPDERRKRRNKNKAKNKERKRGGQRGHVGAHRELLPEAKVSKFVDLYPPECENCWRPLPEIPDASPKRYQHTEIPPVEPFTTEWRRHAVTCPCCQFTTRARYDEWQIPASPFGPRLMAIMALLTGVYHLSRRKGVELLSDLLGIRVSLGALSAVEARVGGAVQPAVDAAWMQVGRRDQAHRWNELVEGRALDGALDDRDDDGNRLQDPHGQQQVHAPAALRGAAWDPGQRPRQGAQLLGNGATADLLGSLSGAGNYRERSQRRVHFAGTHD